MHIFLAIPTIDGSICVETMMSIFRNIETLNRADHSVTIYPLIGDSLVTRARNFLANAFYRQPEKYSHLMWVDSDIEFPSDLILKLLLADKPLVSASYAKKRFNADNMRARLDAYKRLAGKEAESIEELSPLLVNSNLNLPQTEGEHRVENGFVSVKDAATGLMLVRQDCLKLIVAKFGDELMYYNDVAVAGAGIGGVTCAQGQVMYDFFGLQIDPVDRRLLSEDYCFCRRYSQAGGEDIPMLISATTCHYGRAAYRANPLMKWAAEGAFVNASASSSAKEAEANVATATEAVTETATETTPPSTIESPIA